VSVNLVSRKIKLHIWDAESYVSFYALFVQRILINT
jgi:hypothetical protein